MTQVKKECENHKTVIVSR